MVASYDFVPGAVPERPIDDLSRALEEVQRKLRELNAAHREFEKELKGNAEKNLGDLN